MAAYEGNIGMMEVLEITLHGTVEQQERLNEVVENSDYERFKELVKEVLGVTLH